LSDKKVLLSMTSITMV